MTIDKLNSISFSGKLANSYLERKAAQKAQMAEESIKEYARLLINQNRAASKSHKYIPSSAYFGHIKSTDMPIGMENRVTSAAKEYAATAKVSQQAEQSKGITPDLHYFG